MSIFKPKDEKFFDLFDKQGELNKEATKILKQMLTDFPDLSKIDRLKEIGDLGNDLRREISKSLAESFITPFDPEDIHTMSIYMDKVLGRLYSAALRMKLYKVNLTDNFKTYTDQLADLMQQGTEEIMTGLKLLRNMKNASEFVHRVKKLEQEGDMIQREATAELFDCAENAVEIIKWKEIYEQLEAVLDLCEDISEHIDNVIIKHS